MKLFTSVTAKLTQDLQDLLSQNTGGCLSDSVIIQELVSKTGLMLMQTGSLWELVGNVQSVFTAYAALAQLLKNEFSIYIEDLILEDVVRLKIADFDESPNVPDESESRGHVNASLIENSQRKTSHKRGNKPKVPDPVVLSINLNEQTKGFADVTPSNNEGPFAGRMDFHSETEIEEASTGKNESHEQSVESQTNERGEMKNTSERSIFRGRKVLKTVHLKKARKRKTNWVNSQTVERSRKSMRTRVKNHQFLSFNGDIDVQMSQEAITKNEETSKQRVGEIGDSEEDKIRGNFTHLDSSPTYQMVTEELTENCFQGKMEKKLDSVLEIEEYGSVEDLDVTKKDNILYKNVEEQWLKKWDCKSNNIPCPAEFCSYVGKVKQNTTEHYARMHYVKNLKCKFCDTFFSLYRDLKRHLKHHSFNITCEKCGKMYKSERSFREHEKTHQDDFVKPKHECDTCGKKFSTKYVLRYHIKSEHMGMKKSFICPTCGKSFTQKRSYITHANVHMGLRPYVCEVCGVSFPYEKSLREHKYMHDEGKNFKCEVCGKQFKQPSALGTHLKIHKETRDHLCKMCGKGFTQRQALLRHERVHSGDKPFSCSICSKTFNDASIIRRHMIMVHKTNPKDWRSFTLNDTPKASEHFVQILSGELQPQLKVRSRPPNLVVSTQEGKTSDSESQSPHVSVEHLHSRTTLEPSSLILNEAMSGGNISINSSEVTHLKTNTLLAHGSSVALPHSDACPHGNPSILPSNSEASLYHNYQSSLPPPSFNPLQASSEGTGSEHHLNPTHDNGNSENLLFPYMHMPSNYSHYNPNQ